MWVRASFTANLHVISRGEWAAYGPPRNFGAAPDPDAHFGVGWNQRLGHVSHHRRDHWWTVWAGFPTADVAADLLQAIGDHAAPAMRRRMSQQAAKRHS